MVHLRLFDGNRACGSHGGLLGRGCKCGQRFPTLKAAEAHAADQNLIEENEAKSAAARVTEPSSAEQIAQTEIDKNKDELQPTPAALESNEHFVFMQYTGIKDKNGVEIYEGNLLAIKFWGTYVERIYWEGPPDAIAEVFWDVAGLRLRTKGAEDRRYADFWDFMEPYHSNGLHDMNPSETLVIGNIYENPEAANRGGKVDGRTRTVRKVQGTRPL